MLQSERIVIFDLDGTIYQNTAFHTDYIHTLVADTEFAHWEQDLIGLADEIFAGGKLHMNHFYRMGTLRAHSCAELAAGLEQRLCHRLTYEQALEKKDILYLGDAWAVLDLLGTALGCLDKKRSDEIYHRIRHHMWGRTCVSRLPAASGGWRTRKNFYSWALRVLGPAALWRPSGQREGPDIQKKKRRTAFVLRFCQVFGFSRKKAPISSSKASSTFPKKGLGTALISVCRDASTKKARSDSCASVESARRVKETTAKSCFFASRTSLITASDSPL